MPERGRSAQRRQGAASKAGHAPCAHDGCSDQPGSPHRPSHCCTCTRRPRMLKETRDRWSWLAAEGAAVALVARRLDRLDDLATAIRRGGGTAFVAEADLAEQQQALDAIEHTVAELGRLDSLVNNAGIMLLGPALDAPTEEWDRMVALNVQGLLHVTHAALPHLVRAAAESTRQVADVVSISSTAGRVARPGAACRASRSSALLRSPKHHRRSSRHPAGRTSSNRQDRGLASGRHRRCSGVHHHP
ncbi:MAG: hypothetical protein QOF40_809 [Actinomycetota bacterium]|nr:hypothetical protein [Actinomycetota bacterium]